MIPSQQFAEKSGSFRRMGSTTIPSNLLHIHFLLLLTRRWFGDLRTNTEPLSARNLCMPSAPRSLWQAVGEVDPPTWKLWEPSVLKLSGKIQMHH